MLRYLLYVIRFLLSLVGLGYNVERFTPTIENDADNSLNTTDDADNSLNTTDNADSIKGSFMREYETRMAAERKIFAEQEEQYMNRINNLERKLADTVTELRIVSRELTHYNRIAMQTYSINRAAALDRYRAEHMVTHPDYVPPEPNDEPDDGYDEID